MSVSVKKTVQTKQATCMRCGDPSLRLPHALGIDTRFCGGCLEHCDGWECKVCGADRFYDCATYLLHVETHVKQ